MTRLPPLNALRAFDAAGQHLNLRAASEALGVTQGAVAQHVRQLEADLGVKLFERHSKGLAFTQAGRSYHQRVGAAFEILRTATATLRPEQDKVLISVTPTFAAKWLIPNLPDLNTAHPKIDLRILATEKISSFHGDGIDLAIRQAKPPFGAAMKATKLFAQEVIAVAAPELADSPVEEQPKLHDAHDLWPRFYEALGLEEKSARSLRLSQTSLAIDAALSGQGVALVSRFLVERDLEAGRLVQVFGKSLMGGADFYLLRPSTRKNSAAKAVADWLVHKAQA